jgi:hypothetical protein
MHKLFNRENVFLEADLLAPEEASKVYPALLFHSARACIHALIRRELGFIFPGKDEETSLATRDT